MAARKAATRAQPSSGLWTRRRGRTTRRPDTRPETLSAGSSPPDDVGTRSRSRCVAPTAAQSRSWERASWTTALLCPGPISRTAFARRRSESSSQPHRHPEFTNTRTAKHRPALVSNSMGPGLNLTHVGRRDVRRLTTSLEDGGVSEECERVSNAQFPDKQAVFSHV